MDRGAWPATFHGVARLGHVLVTKLSHGFSNSHVWMWELDHGEGWALKNWCFWTVMLVKILESPLDCKEIQPVHPKGNQYWIFIGRTDDEAEAPMLWPPDGKNRLVGKDPYAGKEWQQEKRTTRTRWLNGITNLTDMSLNKLQEMVKDREAWRATAHGVIKYQTQLTTEQWTITTHKLFWTKVTKRLLK